MADNKINVTVSANTRKNITVSSAQQSTEISASADTGRFWAQTAKNWAVSDVIVDNTDYSSKHYAQEAKTSAQNASNYEVSTRETYNSFLNASANALNELKTANEQSLENIETSRVEAVDSINSTKTTILNDIEFVADGEKKEIEDLIDIGKDEIQELTNEIKDNAEDIINRVSLSMFDTILKDHVLTYEESKGLALQGTYVYKEAVAGSRYGYPDFYNKVVEEYNEARALGTQQFTQGGQSISMYIHPNGHMYYRYKTNTKENVDDWYNTFGTAWFYGVDEENERIFLPRDKYFAIKGIAPVVGNGMTLGMTDGTNYGSFVGSGSSNAYTSWVTGFYGVPIGTLLADVETTNWRNQNARGVTQDETKSGIEAHLKPNTEKYLYICVGNTVADTSWVDVVTQVANGAKDIDDVRVQALNDLNNKENAGLSALANASNALRTTQITNCITEVPQRIRLELNNGVLTLKAGSELTYGDGRTIVIENDIVETGIVNATLNNLILICEPQANSLAIYIQGTNATSGTTPPTIATGVVDYIWFDTNTNQMKTSHDTQATWKEIPLPIGIVDITPYTYTNLKQVFNGFGYIGSTIWIDKGVKGLIPNGRNEDGTLNNIEYTTTFQTYTKTGGNTSNANWFYIGNNDGTQLFSYVQSRYHFVVKSMREAEVICDKYATTSIIVYIEDDNCIIAKTGKGTRVVNKQITQVLSVTFDSEYKVTSFNPTLPFRAVDYNELEEVIVITETYVNGESGYVVYTNGLCEQWGRINGSAVSLLKAYKDTNYNVMMQQASGAYGSNSNSAVISTKTTTQFDWNAHADDYYWKTIGYIS